MTASAPARNPETLGDTPAVPAPDEPGLTAADVIKMPSGELPEVWSYSDCVEWAVCNTTDIRRNILDVLQAQQDVESAKDAWLPSVAFATSQSFSNYPVHAPEQKANTYGSTYGVNADWTVWDGNLRKYRLESARLILRQQRLAGEDLVKTLKLGLLQAYMNILYAREAVEIAAQTLEVSDSTAYRAKRLMESGRTSRVDYAQIESQRAQDEYSYVQAQNALADARLALKQILELRLPCEIRIPETVFADSDALAPLPEKEAVYAAAISWLPSLVSNELGKEIYAYDVKAAKSGYLPTIGLTGGLGTSRTSRALPARCGPGRTPLPQEQPDVGRAAATRSHSPRPCEPSGDYPCRRSHGKPRHAHIVCHPHPLPAASPRRPNHNIRHAQSGTRPLLLTQHHPA